MTEHGAKLPATRSHAMGAATRLVCVAMFVLAGRSLPAANIIQYTDRAVFEADSTGKTLQDFENVRASGCNIGLPGAELVVNNLKFTNGVARELSSGPCSPPLIPWKNIVLVTRLVRRPDAPAMAYTTVTLPAGVLAVGFDVGISKDPVDSRIRVTVFTSDGKDQAFTYNGKGTGTGGSRRVEPLFAGFTSSRAITSVRFETPDIIDSGLVLDNFVTGQTAAPAITAAGVLNGASFQPTLAGNTWISIFGKLLSGSSRLWGGEDFSGLRLPTAMDDVSVTINGKAAYVAWVSPGQVNALLPADLPEGPAVVVVSRGDLKSVPATIQAKHTAPGLFQFDAENRRYAAATHADNSPVGKTTLYPAASTPARRGEIIVLWGTGFGATSPEIPAGELVTVPGRLISTPVVMIGGATADVIFAGLTLAGTYQLNIKVPEGAPDGDVPVVVQIDGARTQDNVFLTIGG